MKKIFIIIILFYASNAFSQSYSFYVNRTSEKFKLNIDSVFIATIDNNTYSIKQYLKIHKENSHSQNHFINYSNQINNINYIALYINNNRYWIYVGDTYNDFWKFTILIDTTELDKLTKIDTSNVHINYYYSYGKKYYGSKYHNNNISNHIVNAYLWQESNTPSLINERKNNECFSHGYLPHEIKYGGLFSENGYKNNFYASYYIFGQLLKAKNEKQKYISTAVSYNRMFQTNYSSLFLYYGEIHWIGMNYGLKLEPLLNLKTYNVDYINFEVLCGWFLSFSTFVGIPSNFDLKSAYFGFKVGYGLPYPWILRK